MEENQDLLDDYIVDENSEQPYSIPDRGKRFVNHIIDYILTLALGFVTGLVVGLMQTQNSFYYSERDAVLQELYYNLLGVFVFILYYTLTEYYFKGKSIGKFVTKTRVVRRNGGELTFLRCLGRSCARIIPFDAFSIFFRDDNLMWHDSLSDTMVVDDF